VDDAAVIALARSVMEDDIRAVASAAAQLDAAFLATVDLLRSASGKVLVAGMGTSGATARRVAHLLSCAGTPALFISPADGLHGGSGATAPGDVIIAISKGGQSDELNQFCRLARERGAKVVAMTGVVESSLALQSDCILPVLTPEDTDPGGMMAMGSALAACAVGDALAIVLMRLRDYDWTSFERTHPGGAVGKMIEARQ
jgi:D-arabinose 5-phosphate isomerase GutQ